jgi:hypothetical protein
MENIMRRFEARRQAIAKGYELGKQRRQRAFDTCICDPLDNRNTFMRPCGDDIQMRIMVAKLTTWIPRDRWHRQ